MSRRTTFEWHGDDIERKVRKAAAVGVQKTMTECVRYAKDNHEFKNRTAHLEGSVSIVNPASSSGSGPVWGRWGSASIVYAAFIEFGTSLRRAFPFLRPAAAVVYPKLAENIADAYRRQK
ncbi:MAG: HK97-gp10 family putative phage morphogenesis protein [Elusimicrobiota bacterium]|jgi:HK97 gp10 family phage protein